MQADAGELDLQAVLNPPPPPAEELVSVPELALDPEHFACSIEAQLLKGTSFEAKEWATGCGEWGEDVAVQDQSLDVSLAYDIEAGLWDGAFTAGLDQVLAPLVPDEDAAETDVASLLADTMFA